jgi:cysteine desulfurase
MDGTISAGAFLTDESAEALACCMEERTMHRSLPIYLDAHAGTPLFAEVAATVRPFLAPDSGLFANHQSQLHRQGQMVNQAVEKARKQVADLLGPGTAPDEIVFTSGGTESIVLALRLAIESTRIPGAEIPRPGNAYQPVVITWKAEHHATLDAVDQLRQLGIAKVITLPCDSMGKYDPALLDSTLTDLRSKAWMPLIVSALWASNEVGTIQPIAELGEVCARHYAVFHADGTQAVGWLETSPQAVKGLTMLSCASHKIGGPTGAGALWIRCEGPGKLTHDLITLSHPQESVRPGTLPTASIAGFGTAAAVFRHHRQEFGTEVRRQRDLLWDHILGGLSPTLRSLVHRQGSPDGLPNNLNIGMDRVAGQELYGHLAPFVATSAGSACRTTSGQPSHVLQAMGITAERAHATLRLGLYPRMEEERIAAAAHHIAQAITQAANP